MKSYHKMFLNMMVSRYEQLHQQQHDFKIDFLDFKCSAYTKWKKKKQISTSNLLNCKIKYMQEFFFSDILYLFTLETANWNHFVSKYEWFLSVESNNSNINWIWTQIIIIAFSTLKFDSANWRSKSSFRNK